LKDFLDLPLKEEKFIINNITLDKGIAKNRALLENIFSLFVAINSKVPIFIVGKPGCSKSLSMQLITKSMQGTASEKPFFKKLPKNIIHSYQGSLASTSKGVENIFNKARETLSQLKTSKNKEEVISLIYFDEMGLAEHYPHNPLKVIHSELEYDQNEGDKKVVFVGISNWNLASSFIFFFFK
jgi:ABC-type polysaccharide/polyol phosphate transport system ATPase subunit